MAADQHPSPWNVAAPREAVAESASRSRWAVAGGRWELPDELAALLAPPIVVTAARLG